MKITAAIFTALMTVILCIAPLTAYAEEDVDYGEEISAEIDGLLNDYDLGFSIDEIDDLSFSELVSALWECVASRIEAPLRILCSVFLVIIFTSFTRSMGGGAISKASEEVYGMVCVMAAVTVIVPQLLVVYGEILETLQISGGFLLVYVPIFSAVSVACGSFTSAGVYHMSMLGASEMIVKLCESYFMPILGLMSGLTVTGSIFPNQSLDSLVNLMKKGITLVISLLMSLFVGFVTLKCTISGKADGAAAKTVKMMVSGFIPIVGNSVSDAYSTVKGSFEVIGGTVGAAGIIAIVMMILPKLLEVMIYRAVVWIGAAAADIFSAGAVSKLLKGFDSGLAIAQCVMICYSVIFIFCSAILMQTF